MPATSYPLILKGLHEFAEGRFSSKEDPKGIRLAQVRQKNVDGFTSDIDLIETSLAAGTIPNARYIDLKFTLGNTLERAWDGLMDRKIHGGEWSYNALPKEVSDFVYGLNIFHPEVSKILGKLKKLRAAKVSHPLIAQMLAIFEELEPLAIAMGMLKDLAAKRQPKSKEDVRAKFMAPRVEGSASAKIMAMLTKTVDAAYAEMLGVFEERFLSYITNHPKVVADFVPTPATGREFSLWAAYISKPVYPRHEAYEFLTKAMTPELKFKRNARQMAKDEAKKQADEIRLDFLYKNLKKIEAIVVAKGNFKECYAIEHTISLWGFRGTFYISFEDGSSFYFVNTVVHTYSSRGKPFNRYPLNFSEVIMPNGKSMGRPSEERMNTVFVKGV